MFLDRAFVLLGLALDAIGRLGILGGQSFDDLINPVAALQPRMDVDDRVTDLELVRRHACPGRWGGRIAARIGSNGVLEQGKLFILVEGTDRVPCVFGTFGVNRDIVQIVSAFLHGKFYCQRQIVKAPVFYGTSQPAGLFRFRENFRRSREIYGSHASNYHMSPAASLFIPAASG